MASAPRKSEKRVAVSYRGGGTWKVWLLRFNRGTKRHKLVGFFAGRETLPFMSIAVLGRISRPLMRFATALALAACAAFAPQPAQARDLAGLQAEIERIAQGTGGTVGVGVRHIESGQEVYLNRGVRFPMGSIFKVPVAVQVLALVDQGALALDKKVLLQASDLRPGSGRHQIWVGDLTYLRLGKRWRYLATVMDLFSRRIIGWTLAKNRTTDVTLRALRRAISLRDPKPGLLFHSDRGIEYSA
jgi:hypothetical protein